MSAKLDNAHLAAQYFMFADNAYAIGDIANGVMWDCFASECIESAGIYAITAWDIYDIWQS